MLLALEATRRTVGLNPTAVVIVFMTSNLFGHGLFGVPLGVAATSAFSFVLFGTVLAKRGGSHFFFDLAAVIAGRSPGGPAEISVISSGVYGTLSGSPTSDVVTTGAVTIPLIRRLGYSGSFAGGVEARRHRRLDALFQRSPPAPSAGRGGVDVSVAASCRHHRRASRRGHAAALGRRGRVAPMPILPTTAGGLIEQSRRNPGAASNRLGERSSWSSRMGPLHPAPSAPATPSAPSSRRRASSSSTPRWSRSRSATSSPGP